MPVLKIRKPPTKVNRINKLNSKYKTKVGIQTSKSKIRNLKHQDKLKKLREKNEVLELKAKKQYIKPKNVRRRQLHQEKLSTLAAKSDLTKYKIKHGWRNILAGGVTGTSTIDSLKKDNAQSIQEEIANALSGPTTPSVKPSE